MVQSNYEARFWSYVKKGEGCWEWQGPIFEKSGYGRLKRLGQTLLAHRASWEMHFGPIPYTGDDRATMTCVLHKCDNRRCVNPDHLFLGTTNDNMQDMISKGRDRKVGKPIIDDPAIERVKALSSDGFTQRAIAELLGIGQSSVSRILSGTQRVGYHSL